MATCPSCGKNTDEDFGFVTCASCGAQFMLGVSDEPMGSLSMPPPPPLPDMSPMLDNNVVEASVEAAAEPVAIELPEIISTMASPNMSDIAAYGNSDTSAGREGLLRYNILIQGIDSAAIRESLKEILQDKRFQWDAQKLMASAQSGRLLLKDVSAIKASLVLQQLRSVPLQITWEQHTILQN